MNYTYPQPQYQQPQPTGYGGYRPAPMQYPQWVQTPPNTSIQVRPVSSIEEVRACPIDFDGSVFYFTDVANKRIYTKQINLDGTVSINLYELKDLSTMTDLTTNSSYVTKQEFESTVNQLRLMYEQLLTNNNTNNINTNTNNNTEKSIEVQQQPAAQPTSQFIF